MPQTNLSTKRQDLLYQTKIYGVGDIKFILSKIKSQEIKTRKKIIYENLACAFDIETSSWYDHDKKLATMYLWSFSIEGYVIQGRTWDDAIFLFQSLPEYFNCFSDYKRIIVYVHNLSYEFQFMRKLFTWSKVFALDKREVVQAVTMEGIEFRCSYLLSGYSLAKLSDELTIYKIKKLVGNLDYSLIRHKSTRLDKKEIDYSANDVKVVVAYIWELIEREGNITKIPLTKTGFVRRKCRESCFYGYEKTDKNKNYRKYRNFITNLTLEPDDYEQLKRAFMGGFTHANPLWSGETIKNVESFDFKSDYPAKMVMYEFPMSKPKKIKIESMDMLRKYLDKYACVFNIEIEGLESKILFDNYISSSKCFILEDAVVNNGRVFSAKRIRTTITELDFFIIEKTYKWTKCSIFDFKIMAKAYLPTDLIKTVLYYYSQKTMLKNVEGKELEYGVSKTYINAIFGMMVTDICRDEIVYNQLDEWVSEKPDIEEAIHKHNVSGNRFLYYPWGVWITAYARYDLWSAILECKDDYVYSDTDSVKIKNKDKHKEYFDRFNQFVKAKLRKASLFHKIPFELMAPKDNKGNVQMLGTWEDEGTYQKFKTLGAKRYLVQKNGEYQLTVAGVNKKSALKYLLKQYGDKIFEHFNDELYIPPTDTGKNTLTYIDNEESGTVIDYQGNIEEFDEKSSIHMEPCEYTLSIVDDYIKFLQGVKQSKHV